MLKWTAPSLSLKWNLCYLETIIVAIAIRSWCCGHLWENAATHYKFEEGKTKLYLRCHRRQNCSCNGGWNRLRRVGLHCFIKPIFFENKESTNKSRIQMKQHLRWHYIPVIHNVPIGRIVHRCTECLHCSSMKEGRKQASKVSSNSTERQSKIHTLAQQRVQTAADTTLQIILQSLQKLLNLKEYGIY